MISVPYRFYIVPLSRMRLMTILPWFTILAEFCLAYNCTEADRANFLALNSNGSDVFYITCVESIAESRGNVTVSEFNECLKNNDAPQFTSDCVLCQIRDIEFNVRCEDTCLKNSTDVQCSTCIQEMDRNGPSNECLGQPKSCGRPTILLMNILISSFSILGMLNN